jgi:hypothetical protein
VIEFIENNRDCLESTVPQDAGMDKTADRRSWQRVSELIAGIEAVDKTVEKAIAGIVGISTALKFTTFLKSKSGMDAKKILSDFAKHKKSLESLPIHELTLLNESMFRTIETEDQPDVTKRYIENLELYVKWLRNDKRNEVLAHWTTLYDSTAYPNTKVAILTLSPYIFQNIVSFINDIKL